MLIPFRSLVLALGLLAVAPIAQAAPKRQPPSIALHGPTVTVVVGTLKEFAPNGNLVLGDVRQLRGPEPSPDLVEIPRPDRLDLRIGTRYVAAFTLYRQDGVKRTVKNPLGPQLVVVDGANPAVWKDRPEIERIVEWKPADSLDEVHRQLPRLLDLLGRRDADAAAFAAAEIVLRPELLHHLDAPAQRRLAAYATDSRARAGERALTFIGAIEMPSLPARANPWPAAARTVLRQAPLRIHGRNGEDGVVLAAFRYLASQPQRLEPTQARRWLAADDAAIVEAALDELGQASPATARDALDATLRRRDLPAATRPLLEGKRRELDASPPRR